MQCCECPEDVLTEYIQIIVYIKEPIHKSNIVYTIRIVEGIAPENKIDIHHDFDLIDGQSVRRTDCPSIAETMDTTESPYYGELCKYFTNHHYEKVIAPKMEKYKLAFDKLIATLLCPILPETKNTTITRKGKKYRL